MAGFFCFHVNLCCVLYSKNQFSSCLKDHIGFLVSVNILTYPRLQVYDLTQLLSNFYIKNYATLTKIQQIEWNNRWVSVPSCHFCNKYIVYPWFINIDLLIQCSILAEVSPLFMPFSSQLRPCTLCSGQIFSLTSGLLALSHFEVHHCLILH